MRLGCPMTAKIKLVPTEPTPPPELAEALDRVERLEDAVAALCDTHALEDRIADRVAQKLTQHEAQLVGRCGPRRPRGDIEPLVDHPALARHDLEVLQAIRSPDEHPQRGGRREASSIVELKSEHQVVCRVMRP